MPITQAMLQNWFIYHAPTVDQLPKFKVIREAALLFAEVVIANTPPSADQTTAIRHIRDAVMTANAAIACGGQ
jgi:hypothetical protein